MDEDGVAIVQYLTGVNFILEDLFLPQSWWDKQWQMGLQSNQFLTPLNGKKKDKRTSKFLEVVLEFFP